MSDDRLIPSPAIPDVVTSTILIDGKEADKKFNILSIRIVKEVNKIPFARILIKDGDPAKENFEISNLNLFVPGKKIELLVGYRSKEKSVFKGIIIKHGIKVRNHNCSVLSIECKDEAIKMTSGRKDKFFYDMTDSDAIQQLTGTYGIANDIAATNVKHKKLVQYYVTDWDFILSRAEANGILVVVDDGKLTAKAPDTSQKPVLSLTYGANIYEFEAEMDARNQIPTIKSRSWSCTNQDIIEMKGNEPSVKGPGNVAYNDLAGVASSDDYQLRHGGQLVDQELQAWADSALILSRLAKIRGRVSFRGFSDIKPGHVIKLNGVGDRFNGNAFTSGVQHDIADGEWITAVQFGLDHTTFLHKEKDVSELPASGLIPAINGLHIGKVVQLKDDPDGEDRILVKMPLLDGQAEGLWSRIACLDAGKDRGTFFRPEIGDEVVIGFLNDDPREPVVLGMLNSSASPAPLKAADENPEKGFVSREKIKLIFNDEKKSLKIETPQGNKITLDEDQKSVLIEDQNKNKIEMTSSGINIESAGDIKIKASGNVTLEGVNIEQKANGQMKINGTGGVEVNSSATTVIKGSLVQIN